MIWLDFLCGFAGTDGLCPTICAGCKSQAYMHGEDDEEEEDEESDDEMPGPSCQKCGSEMVDHICVQCFEEKR